MLRSPACVTSPAPYEAVAFHLGRLAIQAPISPHRDLGRLSRTRFFHPLRFPFIVGTEDSVP